MILINKQYLWIDRKCKKILEFSNVKIKKNKTSFLFVDKLYSGNI